MVLTILALVAAAAVRNTGILICFLCVYAAIWLFPVRSNRTVFAVKGILSILLAVLIAGAQLKNRNADNEIMAVHFLDVGQGDSTLIVLPDGKTVLIDGGTQDAAEAVIHELNRFGVTRIDCLIGTHPHADHVGSFPVLMEKLQIANYIIPDVGDFDLSGNALHRIVSDAAKQNDIPVCEVSAGMTLLEKDDYSLRVLSPRENAGFEDLNDFSLILKLNYKETAFLFPGDAGYTAELEILDEDLSCDVLKVGHHGSFGSTCAAFLEAADPEIAVISVGKDNEHNLPNDYVLECLDEKGITLFRTDEDKTVSIYSDGFHVSPATP